MTIATPGNWIGVDLGAIQRSGDELTEAFAMLFEGEPERRAEAERLARYMTEGAELSLEAGVCYAAAVVDVVDNVPILAALSLMILPSPAGDEEMSPSEIAEELKQADQDEPSQVAVLDLPAGTAVRMQGLRHFDADRPDGAKVATLSDQYYVPVPGRPDRVAVIAFISPNVAAAEAMRRLFDAIASSLEFRWA
jgi:hypothetical protein